MQEDRRINHWLIVGLVIAHQLVGTLWYSPQLFAYHWIDASGFRLSALPPPGSFAFYQPFILSLGASALLCYGLAFLFRRLHVHDARNGLAWAVMCWAVFAFAPMLVHHQFAQRPWLLTWLDGARDLMVFGLSGAALGAWGHRKRREKWNHV